MKDNLERIIQDNDKDLKKITEKINYVVESLQEVEQIIAKTSNEIPLQAEASGDNLSNSTTLGLLHKMSEGFDINTEYFIGSTEYFINSDPFQENLSLENKDLMEEIKLTKMEAIKLNKEIHELAKRAKKDVDDGLEKLRCLELSSKLRRAVAECKLEIVADILGKLRSMCNENKTLTLDSLSKDGLSALDYAVSLGFEEIVKLLVENGAKYDTDSFFYYNDYTYRPLLNAVHHGQINIVKYLLATEPTIIKQHYRGINALMISCEENHVGIFKMLVEEYNENMNININDVDPDNECEDGNTPLSRAAYHGNYEIVNYILSNCNDIDVNQVDGYNYSPLMHAAFNGHSQIVAELIRHNADVDLEDLNENMTALIIASRLDSSCSPEKEQQHIKTIEILLENGANMDSTDNSGNTALMHASRSGHLNIVKFLVDNDANIGVVNNDGNNALLIAVKNNNVDVMEYLISQGANINSRNTHGENLLMLAALSGHVEVLEMLMGDKYKDKIDIYSCNDQYKHFTAIHYAIIRKNNNVIMFLLENGLDIKRIDTTAKEHNTSGVLRVYSKTYDKKEANKKEVVKGLVSLINHGAQIFFKKDLIEVYGFLSSCIIADDRDNIAKITTMLITNMTTQLKEYIDNTSEKTLNTALLENIRLGVTENVRKLINYGANIYKSMDTINGNLPVLSYAVSLGNVSVVRVLTEAMYNDAKKLLTSLAKENINEVEKLIEKGVCLKSFLFSLIEKMSNYPKEEVLKAIEFMLKQFPNLVEEENSNRDTPILCAIKKNHIEIVNLLLDNKACVNKKNHYNQTAIGLVSQSENIELKNLFKQKVPHLYQLSDHSSLEIERVNIIPEKTSPLQSNSILCKRNYNEADDDTEKQKEKRLKTHNDETCLLQRNSIICKRNYNDPNDDYEEQKRKKLKTQT